MTADALRAALADRYRLEHELGSGGMATVYLAEDVRHRRKVALKVLHAELSATLGGVRFLNEIELTANLQHPQILPLFDSGEAAGKLYYVMPFIEGETLRARLQRGPIPAPEGMVVLRDVARALAYAHGRGVVHRDIKPENVLLSSGSAIVADFGIGKAIDASRTGAGASLTATGTTLGTPAYMAPEQALGDPIDARTDVYAWGVLAYEVFTGAHPFAGQATAQRMVAAHVNEVPASILATSERPDALVALVAQAMAKRPEDRPSSGAALVTAFDQALVSGARTVQSGAQSPAGERTSRLVIGGLLLLLVLTGAWLVARRATGGATGSILVAASADSAPPSLVVLPFTNIGGASENDIFADGMTEDVISHLASAGGLTVISRTSAMTYKGSTKPLKQIAAELGVKTVLEGSVQRSGSRVRVVARLVDASTQANRWAATFDRELVDVFAIQSEVAQAIADTLRAAMQPNARRRMAAAPTRDTLAYQLFLRGRAAAARRTSASLQEAVALYDAAIRRDSSFALAYAQQANDLATIPYVDTSAPRPFYARARVAVERALALDSTLSEAHGTLAYLHTLEDYDWKAAERESERALSSGPGNWRVHRMRAMVMCALRRDSSTGAEALEAVRLDPQSAASLQSASSSLLCARRVDEARSMARRAAAIDSGNRLIWAVISQTAWLRGDIEEIIASSNQMARSEGGVGVDPGRARDAANRGGLAGLARFMLAEFRSPQAIRQQIVYQAVLHDRAGVLTDLQRRFALRDPALYWFARSPLLDFMRDDSSFVAFLRQMHLDP